MRTNNPWLSDSLAYVRFVSRMAAYQNDEDADRHRYEAARAAAARFGTVTSITAAGKAVCE